MSGPAPLGPMAAKIVVGALIAIGVAVLAGAVWLWPSQQKVDIPLPFQNATAAPSPPKPGTCCPARPRRAAARRRGRVDRRATAGPPKRRPVRADAGRIDSGPNEGANTLLEFSGGPGQPNLAVGDHIRISRQVDPAGATSYAFYDFERTWPLIALAAAFAVVIVAVAGWRGLRALIGIVVAFGVLVGVHAARPAGRRSRDPGRLGRRRPRSSTR